MDRRNPFQHHHHHHLQHHLIPQQQQQLHPPPPLSMTAPMDPGGGIDQRIPQWSLEETNELLRIREEFDQTFMETKRNKALWEVVATRMAEKGFVRSPEQCKSKWKNLVTRYKACEATEGDGIRQQFPFYNEIQSILAARVQRMLWAEATEPSTSSKRKHNQLSSDEEEEEEEEEQEVDEPNQDINKELMPLADIQKKETEVITTSTCTTPRKRAKRGKGVAGTSSKSETTGSSSTLKEVLEEFMRQTVKMEKEWREAWETKERERERREYEWRRRMAELEEERAAAERRWMEREEERRSREEARAQRREILIDALLNKLNRDHNDAHNQGFC